MDLGLNPVSGYEHVLAAISCGCVFMGALTYIGNGPNFMIRAIAQESNVRMPSFLGFMAYSASVLLPLFVLATILFFRGVNLPNVTCFRRIPVVLRMTLCRAVRVQGLSRHREAFLSPLGEHA